MKKWRVIDRKQMVNIAYRIANRVLETKPTRKYIAMAVVDALFVE